MNSLALRILPAALLFAACGSPSQPATNTDRQEARPAAESVSSAEIRALAESIAASPHWATIRRVAPPSVETALAEHPGFIRGRVTGVSAASAASITEQELLGFELRLEPEAQEGEPASGPVEPSELAVGLISIDIEVQAASGFADAERVAGTIVHVPVPVWSGADAPELREDAVADVLAAIDSAALSGCDVLVLTNGVQDSRGDWTAATAGGLLFNVPSAVVFATSDAGLYSLDWLVGDRAEDHFGSSSLDEVAGLTRS